MQIELLGKALAETLRRPPVRFNGEGGTGSPSPLKLLYDLLKRRLDALVQANYRYLVRVNAEIAHARAEKRRREAACAHGFAKDCPTCAHFTKVRNDVSAT